MGGSATCLGPRQCRSHDRRRLTARHGTRICNDQPRPALIVALFTARHAEKAVGGVEGEVGIVFLK